MSEGVRKTGTDGQEIIDAEVAEQTGFERALEDRVSKRKKPVRGPQIKVLPSANDTGAATQTPENEAVMNKRINDLNTELDNLEPKQRKTRMAEVEQNEPDLFAAVKQGRARNKQQYANAMQELGDVRTAGAEAHAMIQGALEDVSAEVAGDLHKALGEAEFTPVPSSGVRGATDDDTDAKKAG